MRPLYAISLALLALLVLQGCAVTNGGRRVGGSKLSEAAAEAKKGPAEKRKVLWTAEEDHPEETNWLDVYVDVAPSYEEAVVYEDSYEPAAPVVPPSIYNSFHIGAVAGIGMPGSPDFGGHSLTGLQIGFYPAERARVDAAVLRSGANFTHGSPLRHSFKQESDWAVDVSARYYFTPEHAAFGVYPLVGVQGGVFSWRYASPVWIEDDYDLSAVDSDYALYVSPYIGLGTSLVQTRHFHFGVQLVGGLRMFDTHTGQGFENDVLRDDGFWQLRFEMTAPF